MRSIIVIFLLVIMQANANKRTTRHKSNTQASMNNLADKFGDKLFHKAFDRRLKDSPVLHADLESATLGKPRQLPPAARRVSRAIWLDSGLSRFWPELVFSGILLTSSISLRTIWKLAMQSAVGSLSTCLSIFLCFRYLIMPHLTVMPPFQVQTSSNLMGQTPSNLVGQLQFKCCCHSCSQQPKTTFDDVEGCRHLKKEMREVVMYLQDPYRFAFLGAKLPRGILMTGPPGTGKTLMARAVAGETNAVFLQCSGSDFDEMYVGVGAQRIRNLFSQARNYTKSHGKCIIFIDELDAVGGKRDAQSRNLDRQTMNQLLKELDGFEQNQNLLVLAATNFPQSLDPALTRAGRIDKTIHFPLPDVHERQKILQLKAKNMRLKEDVDLSKVAQLTKEMSGADLANLLNIAAIRAAADGLSHLPMLYLEKAYDRIVAGNLNRSHS
eukprot:gnl/MRDRNA2_/MRDRNA2_95817_c0_seq1.p1 gnl/MRDRNA2_/MRDRNA2_95817_c0~~gnl/MRDRNA2_/MRDRNA2_95817_c0_seq1.p1  ORF type:complete len:439 (-),score=61.84 gnl/MRDRNA2_/MRDRNA2_95817_c0_seq1:155-1471(-)